MNIWMTVLLFLVGLLLILFVVSRGRRFDGENTCFYFLWYGLGRAWIEGLRTDSLYLFNTSIKFSVFTGFVCFVGGTALLIYLLKKSKNVLDANFIEGMACLGGCIGGAGCLTHGEKNKADVDKYGKEAYEKTIKDAVSVIQ